MDILAAATATDFEATVFLDYFKDMPDHRQPGKVAYSLDEILLLALLSILAGAEGFTDMARFVQKKLPLLQRFLPFVNGTPSHDHLGDIFASLDPQAFRERFVAWVGALTKAPIEVIAIDGKTSRRSGRKGGKDTIHMVSAFAARQRLVLAQTRVSEKSNEIVAIPALLDMLSIEGAIVTIDAMGCQREIARKIVDKKADYVLALKGNQGTLRDDVELFAKRAESKGFRRYGNQRRSNRRRRPWPDRNPKRHRRSRRRLAAGTTPMAGPQRPRHRRSYARNRTQDRTGNPLLPDLFTTPRRQTRTHGARSLGRRKRTALGHGHDVPRRRMPHPNRKCARKRRHPQTHGPQPRAKEKGQGLRPPCSQNRRLGR